MKDLDRIPAPYRERVQRLVTAAREAAIRDTGVRDDRMHLAAADLAARRALVPFLVIADEADAAMHRAADEARRNHPTAPDREQFAHDLGTATRAAIWARRMAELDGDAVPLDLAADAVRAVRSAQRAHLEATRVQAPRHAGPDCPDPCGVCAEQKAADLAALVPKGFFFGTVTINGEMVINNGQGAQAALDALTRYLETHVVAMPVDLVQRAVLALAATLPAGPLAPVEHAPATLRAVVALVKTLPVTLGGQIDLGSRNRVAHDIIAALPGAIAQETTCRDGVRLAYALAEIDGIEIAARYNPERSEVS